MTSVLWFICFMLLVVLGVPIAAALGLGVFIAIIITGAYPLMLLPNMIFTALDSFTLLCVPFFLFCGKLMSVGSISTRIFDFANASSGWVRGGLGAATVVSSTIFGGISGSAVADVGALGKLQVEAMVKNGYPVYYSCGLAGTASILSPLIPPSVIMVVYANVASVSAVKMLISGLVPGLLAAVVMIIVNYFFATKYNWKSSVPFSLGYILKKTKEGALALLTPIILIGGMVLGYFTPTEAAFVASIYAVIIGILVYRDLSIGHLLGAFIETGRDCGVILLILGTAMVASHVLAADGVTQYIASSIFSFTRNPHVILLMMIAFLLFFGCIMETIASIIITVPVFLPICKEVGITPIHFGVIMILSDCIGYITPPVGVSLFAICTVVKGATLEGVSWACLPYVIGLTVLVVLLVFFPGLTEFLPSLVR